MTLRIHPFVPVVWLLAVWAGVAGAQSPKDVRRVAKDGATAIPELRRFLLNPDAKVRAEAVRSLVEIGGPRTLDALIEACGGNDPQVQTQAVNGLVNFYSPGYVRKGLTAPIRNLGSDIRSRFYDPDSAVLDPYVTVRVDVVRAVGRVARGGASLDARANAARAAGVLRGKAAVPDLVEALRSRDSDVLLESLIALEKIQDGSACPGIHFLIRDLDEKIQTEAIEANGVLGCKDAKRDLREVLKRTDRLKVQRAALSAIAMQPDIADRELFASYLESPDERLRTAAAEGYARLASIEDARLLQTHYDAETRNLPRLALAFGLAMDGNLATTEYAPLRYLIYSLNLNNYREAATAYLAEAARNPEVLRALHGSLKEATRDEKVGLARVLATSGDKSSVPFLEQLSNDADSVVSQEGLRQVRNLRARL